MPKQFLAAITALLVTTAAHAAPPGRLAPRVDPATGERTFDLWDGGSATVGKDGVTVRKNGRGGKQLIFLPRGASDLTALRTLSLPQRGLRTPGGGFWASSMATEPRTLEPAHAARRSLLNAAASGIPGIPSNYGLQTSFQAYLNSTGVAATGAFVEIARRFGQLPGQGVRITNVSIGDLTDQAQADAGDFYVQLFGPTSRVIDGQRYLDFPSLPLIPTFVVSEKGEVDPLGTVEQVDPFLGEVLLDFSVMAPLPHDLQRKDATGDGPFDLLGIAPGAEYRLVVPQQPTIANIYTALLAAADQVPAPDVITASLGFGFDSVGFPGRYLEDDPAGQAVIASIVRRGIVVCVSSNDGTRLFTPTAVGPDGGSAALERLRPGETPTSVADDATTTIASRVADSFSIAAGASTLDDIFSAPPQAGGPLAQVGQFPTTRLNGGQGYSSGFGSRVDLSAPGDNIVALLHFCQTFPACSPQDSTLVLSGGTSASAPMVAAAAAVVIQVARLTHRRLDPRQIRDLLVRTGRPLAQAPHSAQPLQMGPQLDVTAAVESLLGEDDDEQPVSIARLAIAHRREVGGLGAAFREDTDPSNIDLQGPDFDGLQGEWAVGPITFSPDLLHRRADARYALILNGHELVQDAPAFRLFPAQLLAAAGLPFVSGASRTVKVRYEVRSERRVLAATETRLVFSPTDGTYAEALAPVAPATARAGEEVTVRYDLTKVRGLNAPALFVSGLGHFSPVSAPIFHQDTTIGLHRLAGEVHLPPGAFRGGAGVYGIGIVTDPDLDLRSQIAVIRITPASGERPEAPLLAAGSGTFGHALELKRSAPAFTVRWNAPGGDGAQLEISAPGPSLRGALNTFSNANGSQRDADGTNSPSTVVVPLSGSSGVQSLDALALGLQAPMFYNLRVFATRHGRAIGEASPTASLQLKVPEAPGGALVMSFDIAGDASTAALATPDSQGQLADSALIHLSPVDGSFGAVLAHDSTGNTAYHVVGTDPALHRTLALRLAWNDPTQFIETWDAAAGSRKSAVPLDASSEALVLSSQVDPVHHRGGLLGFFPDFATRVLPVDLASGSLGAPVALPQPFNGFTFGARSGRVFSSNLIPDENCVLRRTPMAETDLDTGAAFTAPASGCVDGLVSDGTVLHTVNGPLLANHLLFPQARTQSFDEETLAAPDAVYLEGRSPLFPAIDKVHGLLVMAFLATLDMQVNSTATSAVAAYDLKSGARVFYSTAFNFSQAAFGNPFTGSLQLRGIQLNPAKRTAWTFGPYGNDLQSFSY